MSRALGYEFEPDEYEQAVAIRSRGTYAMERDIADLLDDEQMEELLMAGVDLDELQQADAEERKELLEDAGLDPETFEVLF